MFGLTIEKVIGGIVLYIIIQTAWVVTKLLFNSLVNRSERTVTIWEHHRQRHPAAVTECPEATCTSVFNG